MKRMVLAAAVLALAGELLPQWVARWGFRRAQLIAGGAGDYAAGDVAVGAVRPVDAFVSLGTSGVLWATTELFARPTHPYTAGLLRSLPALSQPGSRLPTIVGMVPSPQNFPSGCRFRDRCERATAACAELPPKIEVGPGHVAWCFHPIGGAGASPAVMAPASHGEVPGA